MTSVGGPGYPGDPSGQVHAPRPADPPGYQPRTSEIGGGGGGKSRKGLLIGLVIGGAAIVAAVVAAVFLFSGSESGPQGATTAFLDAVKAQDGAAAAKVTCAQAANLAENFGKAVVDEESEFGTWQKSTVAKAENMDDARATVTFDLDFSKTTVHGRSILIKEGEDWKVCSLDFDQPKAKS